MALHHFKVALAKEYGIEEAIFIDEIQHQIKKNRFNERNFHEGRYWTYNSLKAYEETFPYMNAGKIKRVINNLIDKGILMKGNFNVNQYDRTCWYAFTDFGLSIIQKCYIDLLKMTNGKVENDPPIPTTNTTTNTTISFTPSDEGTDGRLFDDAETSTITMLSSEDKIPYAPRNKNVTSGEVAKVMDEWFERLWKLYERKGNKAKAKKEFAKMCEEDAIVMYNHIPAYLQARPERQYRQDFERYIKNRTFLSVVYSKTNEILYDPEAKMSVTQETPQEFAKSNESLTINGVTYR